ncbi:MAG: tetratricopeptide repeat protein, partial [Promethearchaeota archaeon]
MSKSISLEIERAWDLLNEGKVSKLKETLKLIDEIENIENLKPEEKLTCSYLKGLAMMGLYRLEESIRIGEQLDKESKVLNKPLFSIDALYLKFCALYTYGMWPFIVEDINNCEMLLKSVTQEPTSETEPREATFYYLKGYLHNFKGEFDLAIELQKKSLAIYERYSHYSFMIPNCLEIMGEIYEGKGELEMALNSHKNALELSEGKNMLIILSALSFYYIGKIYYQQGKLDQAIEFLKKDMNILENIDTLLGINLPHYSGLVYDILIRIYLDKNSIDVAREYMARFQKYNIEKKIPSFIFYLSKARLLISSNRTRDRADAERELRKIIESSGEKSKFYSLSFSPVYTPALIELSDLYFEEYKTTHNSEILEEIQPLIKKLLKESKRVNSYSLQAHTYLLQAKLSLLDMNIGDARRNITKAQRIAEGHGLQLLARSISIEHDKLLEYLDKLKSTKESDVLISERVDIASLSTIIERMQGKRTLDPPEMIDEEPFLLLIIGQDGITYFSHPFMEDWDFDDLFGSFMSAFNKFSSEIFEKSIDRIKIDENLILIKPVKPFLVCYVIKGQSYPALQKLNRFSDAIKWKPDI